MRNQEEKIELQKKNTQKNLCEGYHFFYCMLSFLCLFVFLLLSLSTSSHFPSDVLAEWPLQRYTYCYGWYSVWWYHEKMVENKKIFYNLILNAFFINNAFLSHPQWCLAFSWTNLQMLFTSCLIHITIIIHFIFYI